MNAVAAPAIETLEGTVVAVRFHNPANGWTVLQVASAGGAVTAVGTLVNPREGDEYEFAGRWTNHSKYGKQFAFERAELKLPATRKGVIRYLSDIAAGVGPVRAAKIVDALGEDCLEKLQRDPGLLDTLGFLTPAQREEIKQHLRENRAVAELSSIICREGITPRLAAKICARYGADAVRLVKENPYVLAEEMEGVGFLTADRIAKAIGIAPNSPYRVRAAVKHAFREAAEEGHCYLRPREIVARLRDILGVDPAVAIDDIAGAVEALMQAGEFVREGDCIYPARMRDAEAALAGKMRALAGQSAERLSPERLDELIEQAEVSAGIAYHPRQREAVRLSLTSGLCIVTGGPGTGKTEITRAIVRIYKRLYPARPVYLCAPTGRAAKRLSEATGEDARTIHRLLAYHPEEGFRVNAYNPLDRGLLVADEISMADLSLAEALFAACPPGMQVVLVGDADQLPSVGPGAVLRDAIDSGAVPAVKLEYVYRQAEGSGISALAHEVNRGVVPDLAAAGRGGDVTVVKASTPEEAAAEAVKWARRAHGEYGLMGFAVLAPMKKGESGVAALNAAIRDALNPNHGRGLGRGDKVMVVKNDYVREVFNGDLGIVVEAGNEGALVDFGDREVYFDWSEADPEILQLAFASTVHKAQGSEFPCVVVVLTRQHYVMLQRNLLYTAITRAKKHLVLIHQPGAVRRAVANDKIAERNSRLAERLRGDG